MPGKETDGFWRDHKFSKVNGPLKEVDAAAMAWAKTPKQVVEILKYVITA